MYLEARAGAGDLCFKILLHSPNCLSPRAHLTNGPGLLLGLEGGPNGLEGCTDGGNTKLLRAALRALDSAGAVARRNRPLRRLRSLARIFWSWMLVSDMGDESASVSLRACCYFFGAAHRRGGSMLGPSS